jgi:hypothetical protein
MFCIETSGDMLVMDSLPESVVILYIECVVVVVYSKNVFETSNFIISLIEQRI